MVKKILIAISFIALVLAGCGTFDNMDKMLGKWKDVNGFTIEIKKENGVFTYISGNKLKADASVVAGGIYDKKEKGIIFKEEDGKITVISYDKETDQLLLKLPSGILLKYVRDK